MCFRLALISVVDIGKEKKTGQGRGVRRESGISNRYVLRACPFRSRGTVYRREVGMVEKVRWYRYVGGIRSFNLPYLPIYLT